MNEPNRDVLKRDMVTADEAFANFSERGIKPDFSKMLNPLRFHELALAKTREGQHVSMYEQGIIDGSVSYWTLLGGENENEIPPPEIVKWMAKQLFRGIDRRSIEFLHQKILKIRNKELL